MKHVLLTSVLMLAAMTVLTGVLYPVLMTGIAQGLFPDRAKGSIVTRNGTQVGSELIAQKFTSEKYFHERPSAIDYNPMPSGGSNLGPTNLSLDTLLRARRDSFITLNHLPAETVVPAEMLGASASGLDPHISPDAAMLQVERVAHARGLDTSVVRNLVLAHVEGRQWGLFGEPRVNVLLLNVALEGRR